MTQPSQSDTRRWVIQGLDGFGSLEGYDGPTLAPGEQVEVVPTAEYDRLLARLSPNPPRTKVCCPGCGRQLGDVVDSLVRQRGKFKAQREALKREIQALRG